MAADFTLKVGDTDPPFVGQCLDAKGQPIPTTGAQVQFRMTPEIPGLRAAIVAAAAWSDPVLAEALYQWVTADTLVAGLYRADLLVTYPGGATASFPNGSYATVEILPAA